MKVVTICGSMRFASEMKRIAYDLETKKGFCVIQCVYAEDEAIISKVELETMAKVHYKKIDISDAIYVVNIGGYIGNSVKEEIQYAKSKGKEIIYHESDNV